MKTVKAVKIIGPVPCDENGMIEYTCECGHEWKLHMYGEPPKINNKYVCVNCYLSSK
jgi:hypothetical protein